MLIDAHAHLDRYERDLPAALKEIEQRRILTISTSMDLESYQRNLAIASTCKLVLPTFGVHPWNAPAHVDRLSDLSQAIESSPMLGEIGLDYRWVEDAAQYPAQRQVFEFFLAAASKQGKIVNLHTSGAEQDVLDLLDRYRVERAIIHWYSGPLELCRELVARGMYFTIGVELLYSDQIRSLAAELPERLLLTETDNPGGPEWLTGQLGMPVILLQVVQALADLRGTTYAEMERSVQANFERLIRGDQRLEALLVRASE